MFFVRPLGFLQPTEVRRISYEESLVFERRHETEYLRLGFEIVDVPVGPVAERAAANRRAHPVLGMTGRPGASSTTDRDA